MSKGLRAAVVSAIAGAIALVAGLLVAPHVVAISYLVAYTATLAIVTGMLLVVMMAHLSGATWFVLLRRQAEGVVSSLPALAVMGLPLVVVPRAFWPGSTDFRGAFFVARAFLYWIAWLGTGELLRRASRRQDSGADPAASGTLRILSAAGIPAIATAMTFAAFDWMMSVSPGWSSSVYGAYYLSGAMVGALALLATLAWVRVLRRDQWAPTAEHVHALGKLTLAFVLFWGYIWYAQFFVIWMADLPREIPWYIVRLRGAWAPLGWMVLACGCAMPALVLLLRVARRSATVMATIGIWLLGVHYLDVYWLLVPSMQADRSSTSALWDLGALFFVVGSAAAMAIWRQSTLPSVPVGDPLLDWSIRYETH